MRSGALLGLLVVGLMAALVVGLWRVAVPPGPDQARAINASEVKAVVEGEELNLVEVLDRLRRNSSLKLFCIACLVA